MAGTDGIPVTTGASPGDSEGRPRMAEASLAPSQSPTGGQGSVSHAEPPESWEKDNRHASRAHGQRWILRSFPNLSQSRTRLPL